MGHFDGLQRLGNRTNLVQLDQDGVACTQLDALGQTLGIGNEQVVAHQLDLAAQFPGHLLPAFPVLFIQAIFNGDDGVLFHQLLPVCDELTGGELGAGLGQLVEALALGALPLGGSGIHGQHEVPAGLITGLLDGGQNGLDGLLVAGQVGGKAALVAHAAAQAGLVQHALEGVVDLGAPTQALGKTRGAHRHDHELLEVNVIVGMHAAVEDVHHGRGQQMGVDAAQVLVQRQARRLGSGAGNSQRHAQDGVGTELGLVGGTVRGNQRGIDGALVEGVEAHDGISALVVDVLDGLRDALAQIAALVAIAQLASLKGTGRSARRHHRATEATVLEHNLDLDGGIAAAVEHLATVNVQNIAHVVSLSLGNVVDASDRLTVHHRCVSVS